MSETNVRPAALRNAGDNCQTTLANTVGLAKQALADTGDLPKAAGMADMACAGAARDCVSGWLQTLREAHTTVGALGGKLNNTGAVVNNTDIDAASLYRGPVPDIPTLTVLMDD